MPVPGDPPVQPSRAPDAGSGTADIAPRPPGPRAAPAPGRSGAMAFGRDRVAIGRPSSPAATPAPSEREHRLERQVAQLQREARRSAEEHEATAGKMTAANKALETMNTALRSAGEKLEASRDELRSANEELDLVRESEARFRGIVDQTGMGICLIDPAGRITFANPRLGEMLGWSGSELTGRLLADLTSPPGDAEIASGLKQLVQESRSFQLERQLLRREGAPLWAHLSFSGIRNPPDRPEVCVVMVLDIEARKETESGLQTVRDGLERRVQERTTELNASNVALRAEIADRERAELAREGMTRSLVAAQETERGRISRELHDEIGQHVTALLLGLKSLEKETGRSDPATVIQSLQSITKGIGEQIHQVAVELRPTALDDLGLVRALSTFLEDWTARSRIPVEFDSEGLGGERLPGHLETTLYRVIGEALHNILKHAQATAVSVILQRNREGVTAIVEDNGTGFDPSAPVVPGNRRPLGLVGMRERITLVDGDLTIESQSGRGTTIIVRVPLKTHEHRTQA